MEDDWICPPAGGGDVLVIPTLVAPAWEGPKSTKQSAIRHLRGRAGQREEPRRAKSGFGWPGGGSLQAVLPGGMLAGLLGWHHQLSCSTPRAVALRKELKMAIFY